MSSGIELNQKLGFKIGNTSIPDPSEYGYASQSLDTYAERDLSGLLHRSMVDTKKNVSITWKGLPYDVASEILGLVAGESFTLTFPCPEIRTGDGMYTGKYYVGDRKVNMLKANEDDKSLWIVSLAFDMIEF